jgi:hypothetical protein
VGGILVDSIILTRSLFLLKPDRAEAMRLLINIATAGRSYREFICESYGIRAVADCLARTTSDVVADYAKNLLYQLGTVKQSVVGARIHLTISLYSLQGNPKFLTQVYKVLLSIISQQMSPLSQQMGAQTMRLLIVR